MIVLDYIIANEDRHLNNFGAIRNAETLEWLGMAPIYDSGSSLGYDKSVPLMRDRSEIVCKPFKKHHEEQLKLVSSFDWIDFSALVGVGEMIMEILSDKNAKDYMEENRIRVIAELTERRIKNLETLANSKTHKQTVTTDEKPVAIPLDQSLVRGQPTIDGNIVTFVCRSKGDITTFDISDIAHPKRLDNRCWHDIPCIPDRAIFWNHRLVIPAGPAGVLLESM